jgi:4-alpha-glucanotransferase
MPIFVAYDSADVWAHQEEFRLNPDGTPEVVAGVPPDYFSATGQLWGNPHYRWDVMRGNGFRWWVERFHMIWQTVDLVRLDHFRAFAAAWAIPYGDPTAERGTWAPGPSAHLFNAVDAALGELPIIAEDLGVITPDVAELRDHFRFPGMKVLQFAFASDWNDPYLPHNFIRNCVVYTGTHDNDTTVGWFTSLEDEERVRVCRYTGTKGIDISWDFIHLALASVADLAIFPLQDVLRLGSAARMNAPGSLGGNWRWRFTWDDITDAHIRGLRLFNETYGRMGGERRDLPTLLGPAGASGEP